MEINEPELSSDKGGIHKLSMNKVNSFPRQPNESSDAASKPLIKLKPLLELLDKSVVKKISKVKKKEEKEERKKRKKDKKHKVRDRESDEEMDLRNELKRRRAERMNQVSPLKTLVTWSILAPTLLL